MKHNLKIFQLKHSTKQKRNIINFDLEKNPKRDVHFDEVRLMIISLLILQNIHTKKETESSQDQSLLFLGEKKTVVVVEK